MLKFGGFRATIKFGTKDKGKKEEDAQPVANGIYRSYKEEFYGSGSMAKPQKKLSPSMVKLPPKAGKSSTSTTAQSVPNLSAPPRSNQISNNNMAKSTVDVSQNANKQKQPSDVSKPPLKIDPKIAKNQEKEMMKLEKQRLEEQKKQDKLQKANAAKEAKERAAQEAKVKKEREKADKEKSKKGKKAKVQAPPPPPLPNSAQTSSQAKGVPAVRVTNPLAKSNPVAKSNQAHSTDTIESISRSSGPPPYTPVYSETVPNQSDNTGNTSFGKPLEQENSWDFISQHREQMSKGTNVNRPIQKGANLEYSVGNLAKVESQGHSQA